MLVSISKRYRAQASIFSVKGVRFASFIVVALPIGIGTVQI
jgi:hypothetical protein